MQVAPTSRGGKKISVQPAANRRPSLTLNLSERINSIGKKLADRRNSSHRVSDESLHDGMRISEDSCSLNQLLPHHHSSILRQAKEAKQNDLPPLLAKVTRAFISLSSSLKQNGGPFLEKGKEKVRWHIPAARAAVLSIGYYLVVILFFMPIENWGFAETFHFGSSLLMTVGYGNMSPTTAAGKLIVCMLLVLLYVGKASVLGAIMQQRIKKALEEPMDDLKNRQQDCRKRLMVYATCCGLFIWILLINLSFNDGLDSSPSSILYYGFGTTFSFNPSAASNLKMSEAGLLSQYNCSPSMNVTLSSITVIPVDSFTTFGPQTSLGMMFAGFLAPPAAGLAVLMIMEWAWSQADGTVWEHRQQAYCREKELEDKPMGQVSNEADQKQQEDDQIKISLSDYLVYRAESDGLVSSADLIGFEQEFLMMDPGSERGSEVLEDLVQYCTTPRQMRSAPALQQRGGGGGERRRRRRRRRHSSNLDEAADNWHEPRQQRQWQDQHQRELTHMEQRLVMQQRVLEMLMAEKAAGVQQQQVMGQMAGLAQTIATAQQHFPAMPPCFPAQLQQQHMTMAASHPHANTLVQKQEEVLNNKAPPPIPPPKEESDQVGVLESKQLSTQHPRSDGGAKKDKTEETGTQPEANQQPARDHKVLPPQPDEDTALAAAGSEQDQQHNKAVLKKVATDEHSSKGDVDEKQQQVVVEKAGKPKPKFLMTAEEFVCEEDDEDNNNGDLYSHTTRPVDGINNGDGDGDNVLKQQQRQARIQQSSTINSGSNRDRDGESYGDEVLQQSFSGSPGNEGGVGGGGETTGGENDDDFGSNTNISEDNLLSAKQNASSDNSHRDVHDGSNGVDNNNNSIIYDDAIDNGDPAARGREWGGWGTGNGGGGF